MAVARVPGVLHRLPGALEQDPLLRVDEPRLARRIAEERCVEPVHIVQHGRRSDVGGIVHGRGIDAGFS